jgi:glycosyltransferase involved in cell wall biosynthesis
MRVGLVIYGRLDTLSGGYLYDRQLVSYLQAQGDRVEVVSIPWRSYSQHLLDNLSGDLIDQLLELPVDILLQDELNHPSLFYLNRRIIGTINYPIISIVHHLRRSESNPRWKKLIYTAVEKSYLNSVDGFIFNSQDTRRSVHDLVGADSNSIVAYPAGDRHKPNLSQGMIEKRAHQEGPLQILFLGNVIPRKGLHNLLAALGKIETKDWNLSVVGSLEFDPKYAQNIKQSVQAYGLTNKVRLCGSLDDGQLDEMMLNSHILVVPSYHEGFGIAYLEGMGFGLPAIGTTSGGAAEIITNDVNGYLVPSENVQMLAECIVGIIDDRETLTRMSWKARERYLRHPSWENSMECIRRFLEENINQVGVL